MASVEAASVCHGGVVVCFVGDSGSREPSVAKNVLLKLILPCIRVLVPSSCPA